MRVVRRDHSIMPTPVSAQEVDPEFIEDLREELDEYVAILLGRVGPPVNEGVLTLMEVATAYYARACEMNMQILRLERDGHVRRGSPLYKFRTGELRAFLELSKKAADLGSRRLTHAQFQQEARYDSEGLMWSED